MKRDYELLIVGAGLVGLATAYQALQQKPGLRILVLEKEQSIAQHQSGHNSGVIHSGIYYKPGSLKAKNCMEGYQSIIRFAEENEIAFERCGKIIVATASDEIPLLDDIYKRGVSNGLEGLKYLSKEEFQETEPHCAGIKALYVPQTGIMDYPGIARKLKEKIEESGGMVVLGEQVLSIQQEQGSVLIRTKNREFFAKKVVTCGGLYSDKLTKMTNPHNEVVIIPFRGEYYELKPEKRYLVKNLIYPVPDPKFPFLGVHFTRMIGGGVEAGPNAVLAFRKEGYQFFDFKASELMQTLTWPGFYKIAAKYGRTGMGEMYRSLSKQAFTKALQRLIPEISAEDLMPGGAGVRAQACDRQGKLLDDFDIVQQSNIIHVRNAPSPAATSCLSIGQTISNLVFSF